MNISGLIYLTEDASHDAAIELINEEAFGPGRHTRAAARIREQGPHDRSLSFICADHGETIASVRMTPVMAGSVKGHLLGPLAVRPSHKSMGIGRELVRIAIEAARRKGSEAVILVGDPPYYMPLGFEKVSYKALEFPGPVDANRVLVVPIGTDVHARLRGAIEWRAAKAVGSVESAQLDSSKGSWETSERLQKVGS
ncbi:GNAT family N-acetyltransferase [Rhizobium sp. SL42]|uniref:GNAT family N-acetyltransferase n=1 Tax=Rhizobium sp. SL42 TaxID=2806346 RepID=UPI001F2D9934|nr:N-acetyltransferase [Rhizobium sp. SL42]UJW74329.1 N-acetyltransferase [Rhizobium sp. SL42]